MAGKREAGGGGGACKYDPNTEIFQMRAQWKKVDVCKQLWHERWSWLLDERKRALEEADAIRAANVGAMPVREVRRELTTSLKPVPQTTTGFIGWLANKPECKLEIYTSWLPTIPLRLPDAWERPEYFEKKTKKHK